MVILLNMLIICNKTMLWLFSALSKSCTNVCYKGLVKTFVTFLVMLIMTIFGEVSFLYNTWM